MKIFNKIKNKGKSLIRQCYSVHQEYQRPLETSENRILRRMLPKALTLPYGASQKLRKYSLCHGYKARKNVTCQELKILGLDQRI